MRAVHAPSRRGDRTPRRRPAARRQRRQRQDLGARRALRARGARRRRRRRGDPHDHLHREGGGRAARADPRAPARARGADAGRAATEGAFISTIHGFCARLLRAHALAAGIDPGFAVLDEPRPRGWPTRAFDDALEELAQNAPGGDRSDRRLRARAAARGDPRPLRRAALAWTVQSRAASAARRARPGRGPRRARARPRRAPRRSSARSPTRPRACVQALERLRAMRGAARRRRPVAGRARAASRLPGGNGAALSHAGVRGTTARRSSRFRAACEHRARRRAHDLLDAAAARASPSATRSASGRPRRLDFEDLEL